MVHYYYDDNGVAHLKKKKAPAVKKVRAPAKAKGPKHPMVNGSCPQGTHYVKGRRYLSTKDNPVVIRPTCRASRGKKAREKVSDATWVVRQRTGLKDWWANMTPEQKAAQVKKMADGRRAAAYSRAVGQSPAEQEARRAARISLKGTKATKKQKAQRAQMYLM